ncbi:MAG: histidine--tRNA ligase [Parachlamydiaceae bacterium]
MTTPSAPGVFDLLPEGDLPQNGSEAWRSTHLWQHVESEIRQVTKAYGFHEIRTPVFERTELFQRAVGETTDIVSKEMYTFLDKGNRSISLRPEGTASAMRAFIEGQLQQAAPIHKIYYIAPMFRYERAQAGRYRQHHQFGAEAIGSGSPEQDVEMIDMLYTLYHRLGLKNLNLTINSIGDKESRAAFRAELLNYLSQYRADLSAESQVRLEVNPLRILDSKDPKDQTIVAGAPSILNFLNDECRDHFESVQKLLKGLNIPFQINTSLVRGLDYYNKTVFEIVAGVLGAQNSIAGGGRYDTLIKTLGGPDLPATGFGSGIERIIQTMLKQEIPLPQSPKPAVFLIALGQEAKHASFALLHQLRQKGIVSTMDFSDRKMNKIMQYANHVQATYVAVIGDNELKTGIIELKEMASGEKQSIPLAEVVEILGKKHV